MIFSSGLLFVPPTSPWPAIFRLWLLYISILESTQTSTPLLISVSEWDSFLRTYEELCWFRPKVHSAQHPSLTASFYVLLSSWSWLWTNAWPASKELSHNLGSDWPIWTWHTSQEVTPPDGCSTWREFPIGQRPWGSSGWEGGGEQGSTTEGLPGKQWASVLTVSNLINIGNHVSRNKILPSFVGGELLNLFLCQSDTSLCLWLQCITCSC